MSLKYKVSLTLYSLKRGLTALYNHGGKYQVIQFNDGLSTLNYQWVKLPKLYSLKKDSPLWITSESNYQSYTVYWKTNHFVLLGRQLIYCKGKLILNSWLLDWLRWQAVSSTGITLQNAFNRNVIKMCWPSWLIFLECLNQNNLTTTL